MRICPSLHYTRAISNELGTCARALRLTEALAIHNSVADDILSLTYGLVSPRRIDFGDGSLIPDYGKALYPARGTEALGRLHLPIV
jgi:hypothetical protein